MEKEILNLLKKIIKEDEDTFIDITDMDDDSAAETVISKKDIFKKLRDKMSDKDRTPAGFEYGEIVSGEMGEELRDGKKSNKSEMDENIFKKMFGKKEKPKVNVDNGKKHPSLQQLGWEYNDIVGWHSPDNPQGGSPPSAKDFEKYYKDQEDGEIEEGMYGSFDDEHGWYDNSDRKHTGNFDFDFDEEEFSDFNSLMNKHGENQRWFGPKDGKMFFDKYQEKFGGKPFRVRTRKSEMGENEMEEGNAFSGALAKAKEEGKSSFEVDGKKYQVKEAKENKFIQKATKKMDKKGTSGKFGEWCKRHGLDKDGEVTKKCIDKAMKSDDSKVVKMANFAKNIGGFKGAKHENVKEKVVFTESELINFIERLVEAEKVVDKGFTTAMNATKKENTDAIKQVAAKMKDYMKNMGTDYEENPKSFPKGNKIMSREGKDGKDISDDVKKAYKASEKVEEYIENLTASALENIDYDNIKPNEDWITDNIEGSSRTGNSQEYANAVPTDVNKKRNEIRKSNLLGALKRQAYNKSPQPTHEDEAGEIVPSAKNPKGNSEINRIMATESIEDKKILNDMEKMKKLIGYNQKTQ